MLNIISNFLIKGRPVFSELYGYGHINQTFKVVTDTGWQYILQKINRHVFPDVHGLMNNISLVTTFLADHVSDPREAMILVPTLEGGTYHTDENGECWRVYCFIENSICLQKAQSRHDFEECAVAFGRFQQLMAGFPAQTLKETILNFHNTTDRYRKLKEAIEKDPLGRTADVRAEIDFALAREEDAGILHQLRMSNVLPTRVTHNDTKINNVMLDRYSKKALCVIDLDTVMPGLAAYDFGDSIRSGAVTAAEDERDLSKVWLDMELYRVFAKGFLSACSNLTRAEVERFPLGARTMTLECGVRFLTDYVEGDHYFRIHREHHNLDRCRTQFKLVAEMETHSEAMQNMVQEYC